MGCVGGGGGVGGEREVVWCNVCGEWVGCVWREVVGCVEGGSGMLYGREGSVRGVGSGMCTVGIDSFN